MDSLPPIGCFACRLEEIKDKTDMKLGIRNTVGTFVVKNKPAPNPRWEAVYNVLGRVNKKLLTGNFDSGNNTEKDETSVEENSDTFSDLVPNIGQEDVVVSIDDDSRAMMMLWTRQSKKCMTFW